MVRLLAFAKLHGWQAYGDEMPVADGCCATLLPQVRATHGVHQGTWYYEVKVDQLGPAGAAR